MKVHEGKTSANLKISETKKKKQAENETGVIFTSDTLRQILRNILSNVKYLHHIKYTKIRDSP